MAPTGIEAITITIPEEEDRVSLLGEKLTKETREGTDTYSQPGRPIAVVSNMILSYHPAPTKPPARGRGRAGR